MALRMREPAAGQICTAVATIGWQRSQESADHRGSIPVRVLQFGYRKYIPSSPILPGPFNTQMPAELPRTANDSEPSPTVISPPVTASR